MHQIIEIRSDRERFGMTQVPHSNDTSSMPPMLIERHACVPFRPAILTLSIRRSDPSIKPPVTVKLTLRHRKAQQTYNSQLHAPSSAVRAVISIHLQLLHHSKTTSAPTPYTFQHPFSRGPSTTPEPLTTFNPGRNYPLFHHNAPNTPQPRPNHPAPLPPPTPRRRTLRRDLPRRPAAFQRQPSRHRSTPPFNPHRLPAHVAGFLGAAPPRRCRGVALVWRKCGAGGGGVGG